MTVSKLEETLALHMRAAGLFPVREYRVGAEAVGGPGKGLRGRLAAAELRDWRIDFAFVDHKLAIECEGGTWTGGRHTTGKGFDADIEKYNKLTLIGWRVLRFTGTSIKSGVALQCIEAALATKWTQAWIIET